MSRGGWNTSQNPATRSQRLGRLGCSLERVNPVPGLSGDYSIESLVGRVPLFERSRLDPKSISATEVGHPRVDLDPEHPAVDRLELAGCDTGADADVDNVGPGLATTIDCTMSSG